MSDIGGGSSAFDERFFAIESRGALVVLASFLLLLAWRSFRQLPRWPAALLISAALALGPGIAIYWQVAYPSANGIEGAGRLVFGGGATLGNATLAGLGAFVLLEPGKRWLAVAPAGLVIG